MVRAVSPLDPAQAEPWVNWSGSIPEVDAVRYLPSNLPELVAVAMQLNGGRGIRASGSRWSASASAQPVSAWIDTSAMQRILPTDLVRMCDDLPNDILASNLVHVEGGIKLHQLAEELWDLGLSLPTLGGRLGQSLAGAVNTSTHGSDIELPPIPGMVRAIHLVGRGGQEFWLEHPDRPLATQASIAANLPLWDQSIRVRRDADSFNSALVSAGRCGFVYSYVVEVEPAYWLLSEREQTQWAVVETQLRMAANDTRGWVAAMREFAPAAYTNMRSYDVALNPDGQNGAAYVNRRSLVGLGSMAEIPAPIGMSFHEQRFLVDAVATGSTAEVGATLGAAGLAAAGFAVGGPIGFFAGLLAGAFGGGATADSDDVYSIISDAVFPTQINLGVIAGRNYQITSGVPAPYNSYAEKNAAFWSDSPKAGYVEVFFDATETDYLDYVNDLTAYFRRPGTGKQAGFISIRFTAQCDAPLSMQRWPVTASVEIVLLTAFDDVDDVLENAIAMAPSDLVRFHWGMSRPSEPYNSAVREENELWKRGAAKLGIFAGDAFSTMFTVQAGLEPERFRRNNLLFMGSES